jgi:hypothetical protein
MIDAVDRRLKDWVKSTLESVDVRLSPPAADEKAGIGLYLMELAVMPPASTTRLPPRQVALRYLVTSSADDLEAAHRLLGDLIFAAMDNPEFQVELEPVPMTVWTAFGVPPRPSFVLRVPLQQARKETKAKPVRTVPVLRTVAATTLHGVVRGPSDIPLPGAEVQAPALRLTTYTDSHGRFYFSSVPAEGQNLTLRVKAKGREVSATADHGHADPSNPFLIRFDTLED